MTYMRPWPRTSLVSATASLAVVGLVLTACSSDAGVTETGVAESSETTQVTAEANGADVMFAQMMIPHHEQAVVMADLAVDRAEDPQLLDLAAQIKAAQAPEIELMASWLEQWGAPRISGDEAMMSHGSHGMQGMLSDEQIDALASTSGATFDAMFAEYMIEHHEGAVAMANDVLAQGSNPEVAQLAEEIIVTQEAEIEQLQSFLSASQ